MTRRALVIATLILSLALAAPAAARSLREREARHIVGAAGSLGAALAIDPDFDRVTDATPLTTTFGIIYMPAPIIETRLEFVGRSASSAGGSRAGLIQSYGGSLGAGYVMEPWLLKIDLGFAVTFTETRLKLRDELIEYESKTFSTGFSPRVGVAFEIDAGPLLICPGLQATYDHIPTEDFYLLKQLGGVGLALQLQVLAPIKQRPREDK